MMRYDPELVEARLLRRYKRFFADVEMADGTVLTVHCPNPGSMKTCAPDGARVWLSYNDAPTRKLKYTWELVEADGTVVCVNTLRANQVVTNAILDNAISELADFDECAREYKLDSGSRIDFWFRKGEIETLVEVKSATMWGGQPGLTIFPDSVTTRGRKHLEDLMAMVDTGHRATLLFCVSRDPTERVQPADDIDPAYGQTLRRAVASGVDVIAYAASITTQGMALAKRIPVEL